MRFDLTDLRLFVNVHEGGTITAGADSSCMTLASASERIRAMEDSLGAALLLRSRRGVTLTSAGRTLLHHARLVLQKMDHLQSELGDFGSGLKGHVHMLCNTAAISEYLPELLSSFLAEHAGISVDLEERPSDEIVDALRNQLCDLGVVSDSADLFGLQAFPFRPDPLVLVVPKGHPLAAFTAIGLADVLDQPFVGLVKGSALQDLLAQQARRLGRHLHYRIRLRSFEAVCRMVGQGVGAGIVPQTVALRHGRSAGIQRIRLTDAWALRRLVLCVRDVDALSPHSRLLMQHMQARIQSGK
ncbi:MAG TPA: LysR substrate-binding domain-containing protein [Burkholderiaceae bacterium]|jgi:DNA-binding transcriptional LysR family regulator